MNIYYNDICFKDAEALDDKGLVNQYLNYYSRRYYLISRVGKWFKKYISNKINFK